MSFDVSDTSQDEATLQSAATDWDVAVRYHEFRSQLKSPVLQKKMVEISIRGIVDRAQRVLGAMIHSRGMGSAPFGELPPLAESAELDLEATLENSNLTNLKPWMSFQIRRLEPVVLCVDTSLSMTGEKLALTAVAVAVVLLQFPDDPVGVVSFETEPHIIKKPEERISIEEMVKRFLEAPSKGYTDIEDGLLAALKQVTSISYLGLSRPASTVLISDGKYTAGKDPSYLAVRFPHLQVIKIGTDESSLLLCQELSRRGHGNLRQIREMGDLPGALFSVVKELVRGRNY